MRNGDSVPGSKAPWYRRHAGLIVILSNIVLLCAVFSMYALYTRAYDERLREENLGNVENLNRSAAINATALFESWNVKLNDIARCARLRNLTRDEALAMISDGNSDLDRYFELIGGDYKGYLARRGEDGSYPALDFSHKSYAALQKLFDGGADGEGGKLCFAPEYTDSGESAAKFFAMCRRIPLGGAEGAAPYTLMLATDSKNVLEVLNGQMEYRGQSSVLIDAAGNYIVSSQDYKSSNFFQYLYVYNELSMDEKTAVQREMEEKGEGELYFRNADLVVEDCVFRYERMAMGGWYCVTCVPLSSFHAPSFNISYLIYAIALLSALFGIDLIWLQSMNRRLRASVRREREASAAKGNFMSRMSHEIRTPLNAVIGYNTIARNEMTGAKSDAERRQAEMKVMDCLDKSGIASKHLLTIINDVLDMSAIESGKIEVAHERFDFRALISSLTTVFYSQAKAKGVELSVVFDTLTEEWFVGDQMRTNQILTNLLSNAVKFTPAGGSVTLKIFQPEAEANAAHLHFEVTDTGIGMTEEYLKRIWTPFEQADSSISRRFGGTGLGLSITKNLVDLMGGSITVKSAPGAGTSFGVDLVFERTEQPPRAEAYDFESVNALVADDDAGTRDYIRLLFERCGARCELVRSGEEALEAVSSALERGQPYSLCILDWRMSGADGIETARRIRGICGDAMPLVVLTAYDYSEVAEEAAGVGVDRFLSKPLFQSSLFDLLASVAGARRPAPSVGSAGPDFKGARVLLAEDNAMNMEIAKTIMESAGLVVDSAWNGREAVELFEASAPGSYMAILMDVHMPEMDGYEATRTIRACAHPEAKTVPIIAMTADAFAENVAEALASGMNAHIAKPIDIPTLFNTLERFSAARRAKEI